MARTPAKGAAEPGVTADDDLHTDIQRLPRPADEPLPTMSLAGPHQSARTK